MKLTVNYENGAVLTLQGACFWSSSAYDSCTEQQSSLPCGLVIYGTYSEAANQITFTACNDPKGGNGSGKVDLVNGGINSGPSIIAEKPPA
jgi:hypothetical protein